MKVFSAKVEEGREGLDEKPAVGPVYRNLLSKNEFPPPDPNISTAWDVFSVSVEKNPQNRMLGWRKFVDGKLGPYVWKTYKEVYDEVMCIGSALRASGAEPGSRVGIYGSNCPQWIMAMEACNAHSLVCVPLYDTLGPGAVNFILDHAEVDFVFVQDKKVKELLNPDCKSAQRLKIMVCFTSLTEEEKNKAAEIRIKPYSWNEFLHMEGFLSNVEGLKGVQHVVLLSQLSAYRGSGGIQALMKSNARKLAEQDESFLMTSGIPYTIIRAGLLQSTPGGQQGFSFEEGSAARGNLSKEDAAFICVQALDAVPQRGFIFEVVNGDEKISDWQKCMARLMEKAGQQLQ